jgi:hypothetical protein
VGIGGVVHIRDIDRDRSRTDAAELAGLGPSQHARNEVRIAGPPNEVRPQRDRGERRTIRREHGRFRERLRRRVVREEALRVRQGFSRPFEVGPGVDDARRTRVDEPADTGLSASVDHVLRPRDVRSEVVGIAAPDPGLRRDVKDDIASFDGGSHLVGVAEVAVDLLDAEFREPGVSGAREGANAVAARQ